MKASLFLTVAFATVLQLSAMSVLLTLEQKVTWSSAVLRISISEATLVKGEFSGQIAVCKGAVVEVLKGQQGLTKVEFRVHPYGSLSPEELPGIVGKEFVVFLHQPPHGDGSTNEFWALQGPQGVRATTEKYEEYKIGADGEITTETLGRTNFLAAIRGFVSKDKQGKK